MPPMASLAAGLPAAAGPRGGHPARQAPHRSLVRTGSAGPPAASRGMLGAARMPEGRGHRRSPRPFLWPLARHARQGRCLHPGLAAASRGGRLRSGGLEVVTIGPLRSPVRVLEVLRERDPAPGPSQDHTISILLRGLVPRAGRGGQAVVHRCDCRPGMTSCHQVARPARKGQSRSRHRGCLLTDTPADGHPPRRRDPVPGPTAGDPELAGHPAGAGGPGGAHRDDPGRPAHVPARPPCG
jgi:hypothetical protein